MRSEHTCHFIAIVHVTASRFQVARSLETAVTSDLKIFTVLV